MSEGAFSLVEGRGGPLSQAAGAGVAPPLH